jgi:CBS domain-containing protein
MTERVVTVPPTTPIRKAANLMRGRSIGCLVVSNRGRVAGIVTVSDLLTLLGRGEERPTTPAKRGIPAPPRDRYDDGVTQYGRLCRV